MNLLETVLNKSNYQSKYLKTVHPEIYYSNLIDQKDWKYKYNYYCRTQEIENNWILYESHSGAGMLCNPLALFNEFQKRTDFNDYLHIWVIADDCEISYLKTKYINLKNVLFVKYNTIGYAFFVAKAKFLINNTSFQPFFAKRQEQIYINTWHSITVKTLGFDIPDGKLYIKNILRNFLMADYIISPNEFMTNIFNNSFRLNELFKGKYIEEGYPRNDIVINAKRQKTIESLIVHGVNIDPNKKIILYAPTWTGNDTSVPKIDIARYTKLVSYLKKTIDTDKYQILIKPHQTEYRNMTEDELNSCNFIAHNIDANELLSVTDIVITDYSSIYFDFLISKKPILFYTPDIKEYKASRGLYFNEEELPGPCAAELEELANYINNIKKVKTKFKSIYEQNFKWACKYDDGHASERILNILIDKKQNHNILSAPKSNRKTILFYSGSLSTNGVTSAFLSLLKNIDYNKFDVSLFLVNAKNEETLLNLEKIPSQVRTIIRVSAPPLSAKENSIYEKGLEFGCFLSENKLNTLKRIMSREFTRIFGQSEFDYIIDYSGYGLYFPLLITMGNKNPNTKKFIWQHSDLLAEFSNEEKRKINKTKVTLESLSSVYKYFDKIVSSTKSVYKINKQNLATAETKSKFTYATNLLDIERILKLKNQNDALVKDDTLYITNSQQPSGFKQITSIPIPKNSIKFATMGRCMPEKNHYNLISAIKQLNDAGVDAILYIIGDGPLYNLLIQHAEALEISHKVVMTGRMENPFTLLKKCDCFVFPSFYEAQGLAVLEARILKLPIIVSNYKAVDSILIEDKQYIIKGFTENDIYEGLKAFVDGKIPTDYKFDVEEYNKKSLKQFNKLFE